MKYNDNSVPIGLGQIERERLSKLLRKTQTTISVSEAAEILNLNTTQAAKILSLYSKKGWLKHIHQSLYLPVPLDSPTSEIIADEPFIIAEKIFSPCYISGMNAANHWGLTEQIFQTITVMTQKQVKERTPEIAGAHYNIHTIQPRYFFGLKSVWFNNIKVNISDPTRTIVDMMLFPQFCGGLNFISDVLKNYFNSKYKDTDLLASYLERANNGAAIKRIGFLTEKYYPDENKLIHFCLKNITKGYSKIVPKIETPSLVRRWNLWVPTHWKDKAHDN
jgi:predicted transcriptional regulator of viral defense system